MKTQIAATFSGGQFKPDECLLLAEDARVNLTVEVLGDETEPDAEPPWDPQNRARPGRPSKHF